MRNKLILLILLTPCLCGSTYRQGVYNGIYPLNIAEECVYTDTGLFVITDTNRVVRR